MLQKIKMIIETAREFKYFDDSLISLHVNTESIIREYSDILFSSISNKEIIKKIEDKLFFKIDGFNITFILKYGINPNTSVYSEKWRIVRYTFWSGQDEHINNPNPEKYGIFDWNLYGDLYPMPSSTPNIKRILWEYDENDEVVYGNFFEYSNTKTTINKLIKLEKLIVKQREEQFKFYDSLKLSL